MAQPSRKRRTKHRGNAAGVVEARGRTGRPPSAEERKRTAREAARAKRRNTPPSWNSALKRGVLAAAFVVVALLLISRGTLTHRLAGALFAGALALVIYVATGYYVELFLFRRQASKERTSERQ